MYNTNHAEMVELVDTRDLKSLANYWRAGSTPALGTELKACIFNIQALIHY